MPQSTGDQDTKYTDDDDSDYESDCGDDDTKSSAKKNQTFSGVNDMIIAAIDKVGKDPLILFFIFIIVNLQAAVDLVIGRFSDTTVGTQLTNKGIVLQGLLMVLLYTTYKLLEGYIF